MLVLVLSLLGAAELWAQQRQVSGRVTNSLTNEPVVGAVATVAGTTISATTNALGEFTLSAPEGPFSLQLRAIGFKRRTVAVAADQATLSVALEQDIFNLEAVVITGQATGVAQRNLPNAVTTVRAAELVRAPAQTIETALQGKIPGALIQANSGAPGGGAQIQLRGVSTINGAVDPLIVVDGLIVSNNAIGNNINAVTAAAAGGNASNQDNPVNRIADLNPADYERIEILKGASAAAIYGSQASNGVIILTTRSGEQGRPRFSLSQRLGQFRVSNYMKSRTFADSAEAVTVYSDSALVGQLCNLPNDACPAFNNIGDLWDEASLSTETNLSVSGGGENTQYYLSGLIKRDGGIAPGTSYQKQALRANLDQALGERWNLGVRTQVVHSLAARGISNNDNPGTSPYLVFPLTPSFVDLRPTGPNITDYPDNPFERSNPLQTYAFLTNDEDVWRALGSATLQFSAIANDRHNLRLIATGGFDQFTQRNDIYSPPELEFEPNDGQPGTVVLGKSQNLNLNLVVSGVHTFRSGAGLVATTSVGVQYGDRQPNLTNVVGRNLPPGQRNVALAPTQILNQQRQPVKDMGLFLQEELMLMDERLLLTGGVRADRSSRNGVVDDYFVYPKAAASYLLGLGADNEIKLRAAWGQTGIQPNFFDKFTPSATATIGGQFGTISGAVVGDALITPERNTELEGGFDATLISGRLFASATVFHKQVTDMLLVQTLAPSTGRATRVFNGGKLRNIGVELGLNYAIVQSPSLSWVMRGTFFTNKTKVLDLPVPAFQVGGFGTSLGAFQIEEGQSATQIIGLEGVIGDANPDFQISWTNEVGVGQFDFAMLWDWKQGGDVINLTEFLFDAFGNSEDWATGAQQRRTDRAAGRTKPYVQDGSYMKLRELSVGFRFPAQLTRQLFGSVVGEASVTLAGRNLIRITDFRGMDPEVSNFGNQAIARNIDVAPFPPSRSVFLSIDLSF
jgi:TonB-linked SusC/RagA family outer membrane protein